MWEGENSPCVPLIFPTDFDSGETVGKLVVYDPWSGVATCESITPGGVVGGYIDILVRGVDAGVLRVDF